MSGSCRSRAAGLVVTLHSTLPPRRICSTAPPTHPPRSYTWSIYATRLVSLAHTYTFWKHVTSLESRETKRYLGARAGAAWAAQVARLARLGGWVRTAGRQAGASLRCPMLASCLAGPPHLLQRWPTSCCCAA